MGYSGIIFGFRDLGFVGSKLFGGGDSVGFRGSGFRVKIPSRGLFRGLHMGIGLNSR